MNGGADPIAIIGLACRFPGAHGPEAFWRLLRDGVDAIRPITRDALDPARFYDPRPRTPGRMTTRWGGLLDDLEQFDAAFFGISPREAASLDPAQRLLLEAAWEACEDAGVDVRSLGGTPVGVFVGQWTSDFECLLFADPERVDFHTTMGTGRYAAAGRLSYALGLTGPSLSLDTACSSSLVAVHLACQSLRTGESSLAIAAGVNVILQPHIGIAYSQAGMMAADGRCKFGDAGGDGYVRSEGVGLLLLKPLARALADGDPIRAVIRGSAVNNDGRSSGQLGRPSRAGQAEMLRAAYRNAGVAPASVGYVEAHGTGTRVGDPVELGALGEVLAPGRPADARVVVGSVKTNIGHTEGAAGMAGIIKGVLALEHEAIPGSLHLRTPNPAVPWAELPFDVAQTTTPWPRGDRPRLAGVNGFGIAGTNAHVVLEEAPTRTAESTTAAAEAPTVALPLALSAATPDALRALAAAHAELLARADAPALADVCATAARHRTPLGERAVFVAADRETMADTLRRFAAGDLQAAAAVGHAAEDRRRRIAFVFPGQGGQWTGMARELLASEPAFAAAIARCDAALPSETSWTARGQLLAEPGAAEYRLHEIGVLQPVLLAVEIALAELWRSLGVEPEAVVGHSMGEVGAAYLAGALSLDDAMRVICARSSLLQRTSGAGAMAVLELPADEAARRIAPYGDRVCVAVSNGPRSSVVSGEPDAVAAVRAAAERDGIFCRAVQVDVASHGPQMDPLVPELVAALSSVQPHAPSSIALYSTVDAAPLAGPADAGYWGRNLRRPVLFAPTIARMLADGIDAVIEVGPHPALLTSVAEVAAEHPVGRPPVTLGSLRRSEPERATLLASLGALWAAGHPVAWDRVFPAGSYARVALPRYPWQRERHWIDVPPPLPRPDDGTPGRRTLDETKRSWLYVPRWVPAPLPAAVTGDATARRWLVVGAPVSLDLPGFESVATVADAAQWAAEPPADDRDTGILFVADPADAPAGATLAWHAVDALHTLQAAWPADRAVPRLWWTTIGAHVVDIEAPLPAQAAEQGALWGAARVIATEHPDWWGGLVDLDAAVPLAEQGEALARHLAARPAEDQVALRDGARFALRLVRPPPAVGSATTSSFQWRTDGAYLITGGFGGVARRIALEMVRQGARRLVLLGRTPLPPRAEWVTLPSDEPAADRVAFVRALEQAGASVHLLHADVGDDAQLRAALDDYRADGWPPIVGVLHTAGVLDTRLTRDMTADAFARVLAPKLGGAVALDRLLPELDLFVLFSSMMAFWAPPGEANYAAANAGLDALAQARRARGAHALSIQWGPWHDLGLWRGEAAERSMASLAREGVRSFSPDDGAALLTPLLSAPEPVVAVLPVDWTTFAAARRGRPSPLFRQVTGDAGADAAADAGPAEGAASGGGLRAQLRAASPMARRTLLEETVRAVLGAVLRLPARQLDAARPFGTMGLDSMMALELRNRLEAAIERPLSATLAWNYPTVAQLAAYLETLLADTPSTDAPRPAAAPATEPELPLEGLFDDLALLSDEEASRMLRDGR